MGRRGLRISLPTNKALQRRLLIAYAYTYCYCNSYSNGADTHSDAVVLANCD
jgi:hypothetical protein